MIPDPPGFPATPGLPPYLGPGSVERREDPPQLYHHTAYGHTTRVYDCVMRDGRAVPLALGDPAATHRAFVDMNGPKWIYTRAEGEVFTEDASAIEQQKLAAVPLHLFGRDVRDLGDLKVFDAPRSLSPARARRTPSGDRTP